MTFILILIPAFMIVAGFGLVAHWIALRCLGIPVDEIRLGFGSPMLSFQVAGANLTLGRYPTGGSISFDVEQFGLLPKRTRILACMVGALAHYLLAAVLLRYDEALYHVTTGFSQIISGAWSPRSQGVYLISRFVSASESSPSIFVGILAAKLAAWDLLPLGGSGAKIVCELFLKREGRVWMVILTCSALLGFAVFVSWSIAMCLYAFGS